MAFDLKQVGLALSSFVGQNGTTYEAGAAAAAANVTATTRNKIQGYLAKAGKALGPILGQAIPAQIAAGAAESGGAAVSQYETKAFGFAFNNLWLYVGLGALGVYLIWKFLISSRTR